MSLGRSWNIAAPAAPDKKLAITVYLTAVCSDWAISDMDRV
nr:hypothetical protein [Tanacetum cinerariifolium]